MWIDPKEPSPIVYENVNEKLSRLKGELTEEQARQTLGEFLRYNMSFLVEILMGFRLYPEQAIYMRSWFENNFNICVAGRGCAKSTLVGVFAILYCLFHPNSTVLIVSQNFRSSRRILENIERMALAPSGVLLRQLFKDERMSRRGDIFQWTMINESRIICVPLSNGEGLRGLRCNVLIVDEALLVPIKIIEEILQPFLVASGDIKEKQRVREMEDMLIKMGKMKEEERKVYKSNAKMILLSSASYRFEDLFKVYSKYLERAGNDDNAQRAIGSYGVVHFSYESVPKDVLDASIIEDIKSSPQSVIDREYRAIFIESTNSYFSAKKLMECTVPDGQTPTFEIVGDPNAEYVLGIDPSFSSSEASDHFAMCLMKIIDKNGEKIGMVVNQYAESGKTSQKDHILYLYYLLTKFNIVYIAIDSSGGDNNEFINTCNNSSLFVSAGINLKDIDAEFHRDDMDILPRQIRNSYNLTNKRIVQKQGFHSAFQRAANEYLVMCIEQKKIIFAGNVQAIDGLGEKMSKYDISILLDSQKGHSAFNDPKNGGIFVFMDYQSHKMKLVKDECVLIEITLTPTGSITYDLPSNLRTSRKNANRPRKDSYSAMFLTNWALNLYVKSKSVEKVEYQNTFAPLLI